MKKLFVLLLSAAMVFSAAAALADNAEIGGELVIWEHSASFEDALKSVVEGFQEMYPNVEIETSIKTSDQYYNLLQTAMQAGECPDLFWTNGLATTNYKAYADQGLLMDLTGKVDFSLYDGTSAMNIVTMEDGSIYSTPTAETGGRAVFYNKELFAENGWEIPATFSEFEALLAQIVQTDYIPIAFGPGSSWEVLFLYEPIQAALALDWIQEYEQTGYADVNDERVIMAYDKLLEWGELGYYGRNYVGVTNDGAVLSFSMGQSAMYIGGTWTIATIEENNPALDFGAFQIPCEDGQVPFVSTNSCGFAVSNGTENADAALAFANYFASVEGQSRWLGALGSVSCTPLVVSDSAVVNDVASTFTVQAESYYNILGFLAGTGDNPCNVWEEDQLKVISGSMTVKDFVDELAALCLTREEVLGQ
ncbi:MAG TPA: extracellular solute-binding protein [Candidatus Limiplasma sp.]|nr:extracellular solute-binding protein [Candidatus Limiplasma sp.]